MSSMSPFNNTGVSGGRKWKHIFGWVCKLIWTKGTGLDTNFFPNLVVGQPSNNINLSEIEIYLGMIIIILHVIAQTKWRANLIKTSALLHHILRHHQNAMRTPLTKKARWWKNQLQNMTQSQLIPGQTWNRSPAPATGPYQVKCQMQGTPTLIASILPYSVDIMKLFYHYQ